MTKREKEKKNKKKKIDNIRNVATKVRILEMASGRVLVVGNVKKNVRGEIQWWCNEILAVGGPV